MIFSHRKYTNENPFFIAKSSFVIFSYRKFISSDFSLLFFIENLSTINFAKSPMIFSYREVISDDIFYIERLSTMMLYNRKVNWYLLIEKLSTINNKPSYTNFRAEGSRTIINCDIFAKKLHQRKYFLITKVVSDDLLL